MTATPFETAFSRLPQRGWLTSGEARLLWDVAIMESGDVLEIGTYCGRSAVLLASALKHLNKLIVHRRRVFCCDPFLENFDDVDTPTQPDIVLGTVRTLCTGELAPYVTLCWQTEQQLREAWLDEWRLGLVYIDGDHSYEGTLGALKRWAPLAGIIAMHDYGMCQSFEGVQRAARDYGLGAPLDRVESMAVFRGQS